MKSNITKTDLVKKGAVAAALFFGLSQFSHAALQIFTDRASWQTAAGGGTGALYQDFNSYTSDITYDQMGVDAGFISLDVVDGRGDNSWRIDAVPQAFGSIPTVNGTAFATTLGFSSGSGFGDTLISFESVSALGFDYSGASYSNASGLLATNLGDTALVPQESSGSFFLGLLYTEGESFTSLRWGADGSGQFAAGIDNVKAYSAVNPVPVPTAFWLFGSAVLGLMGCARGRRSV